MCSSTTKPVMSTDNNPGKAFRGGMKVSVYCIIVGVITCIAGQWSIDSLNYFSKDYEEILAIGIYVLGIILILGAVVYPFGMTYVAKKCRMHIYEDCITGECFRIVANSQTLVNFQESYDKISSVSTIKNNIMVNLKDGSTLRCNAYNAEDVAAAIRARIV